MPLIPLAVRAAKVLGLVPDLDGGAPPTPSRASITPRIETQGLAEFRRDLKRLDKEIDKELRGEIREAAGTILIEARSNAPMRSGALAKSLKVGVTTRGASIYSNLPYAPVVHWGGRISPRGVPITFERTEFISKAVDRGADNLVKEIADGVDRAAKRAGWH